MTDHVAKAQEHLAAADHLTVKIGALFGEPVPDPNAVNHAARQRASHNKRAEVHALLGIAQRVDDLARTIEGVR